MQYRYIINIISLVILTLLICYLLLYNKKDRTYVIFLIILIYLLLLVILDYAYINNADPDEARVFRVILFIITNISIGVLVRKYYKIDMLIVIPSFFSMIFLFNLFTGNNYETFISNVGLCTYLVLPIFINSEYLLIPLIGFLFIYHKDHVSELSIIISIYMIIVILFKKMII